MRVKTHRRRFLESSLGAVFATLSTGLPAKTRTLQSTPEIKMSANRSETSTDKRPMVLATWNHGAAAAAKAWAILDNGRSSLDAAENGVAVVESDLSNRSVGLGGRPDRDGVVTLDACIQDHDGRAGAVAFPQGFESPVSIARAIMERTPHVMLVGRGAERWALENGFSRKVVEIPDVRQAWQEWLESSNYKPRVNIENHDTIGLVAMDKRGRLAGACTTSGLACKIHGRVGDSPIIGAGLFVDGDVGAACATGVGELAIRIAGSHTVVEGGVLSCQLRLQRLVCRHACQKPPGGPRIFRVPGAPAQGRLTKL